MNFKNFGNDPGSDNTGTGRRPQGNFPLARQPSVYSLTFDQFTSTMGGSGKDFGSMNMDELLKNIWTAEETQTMPSSSGNEQGNTAPGGLLQRQGSLTLPRTLSQKTVDQVWKDISKDYVAAKDGIVSESPNLPQRQQTLGEMTLEEFFLRAGVVREDTQLGALPMGIQQLNEGTNLMGNRIPGNNHQLGIQNFTDLPLNANGVRLNEQQSQNLQPQPQQQQIFPRQPDMTYATQIPLTSNPQQGNQGTSGGIVGLDQGGNRNMVGLGAGIINVARGLPAKKLACDEIGKSNGDSSVSPVPFVFNGGLRGRKSSVAAEKVIERRQRRMIKNRESAARSRARKQAHTMELEAEVARLKEENEELRRKQEKIMKKHKNQIMEMRNLQEVKKRCLRRTQTGKW